MGTNEVKKNPPSVTTPASRGRADRKILAFRLHLEGMDEHEVKAMVKKITGQCPGVEIVRRWISEGIESARLARPEFLKVSVNVELSKIDLLEREYWEAWRRSCEPKVKTRKVYDAPPPPEVKTETRGRKKKLDPAAAPELGPLKNVILESESQSGDVKHLLGVQWCIEQRLKLNGTSAPKENEYGDEAKETDQDSQMVKDAAAALGPRKILFRTINRGEKQIGNG